MRILLIPLSYSNIHSNEHIPNRLRMLSLNNEICGLELPGDPHEGVESAGGFIRQLSYSIKVLVYAITHKSKFDLVFCIESYFAITGILIGRLLGKPCVKDSAIVNRFHYLEMRTFKSRVTTSVALAFEKSLFRLLDLTTVICEADRETLIRFGSKANRVAVAPLSIELRFTDALVDKKDSLKRQLGFTSEERLIFFNGNRGYPPNMRAADWINRKLAREIAGRCPATRFVFTGSGPVPESPHPAALFTGYVPNYFEYLCCADAAIIPLRPRSGVLVKMLDAMACGLAAVVFPEVARGIPELKDRYNVMIASDETQFIQKTLYLLDHPEYALQIGARARETVKEFYSTSTRSQQLGNILAMCMRGNF